LLVRGIKVLVLVYNQMLQVNECDWVEISGYDLVQTLANYLSRQNARVGLRSRSVESDESHTLCRSDRGIGRSVIGGCPLASAPKRFVLAPDLFSACFPKPITVPEFRVEHVLKLPVIQH
jgi:hypothetical protein